MRPNNFSRIRPRPRSGQSPQILHAAGSVPTGNSPRNRTADSSTGSAVAPAKWSGLNPPRHCSTAIIKEFRTDGPKAPRERKHRQRAFVIIRMNESVVVVSCRTSSVMRWSGLDRLPSCSQSSHPLINVSPDNLYASDNPARAIPAAPPKNGTAPPPASRPQTPPHTSVHRKQTHPHPFRSMDDMKKRPHS